MTDAVQRRKRSIFHLLHRQAFWRVGQVGALGVEQRVIVTSAQFERDRTRDCSCNPALGCFAQHDGLGVEPAALVEQAPQFQAVHAVLLDRVLVVDARDQAFVGDVQQGQAWSFVNSTALGFNDAVLDLIAHAQSMAAADAVGFEDQFHGIRELDTVQRDRLTFFKTHGNFLALDFNLVLPESDTHDGVHNANAAIEEFQILGFMRGPQHVAVGAVGFFGAHLVTKACLGHECRHFSTAAEFIDEQLIQPGLVNTQRWVGQEAIAVETLNVVALEGGAVAPDVDIIFLHGRHQHGACHRTTQWGRVEVGESAGRDMEGACLQSRNAFMGQLQAAIDQACLLGAVLHGFAGNGFVIGLVGLPQVGCIGVRYCAFELHPVQGCTGVQTSRESDTDFLTNRKVLKNGCHVRNQVR